MYRLAVIVLLVFSLSSVAETHPTEEPDSELLIIEQNRYGEFLVAGDVDWAAYTKVRLEKAEVTFRERWVHDQWRRSGVKVSEKDQERIKSEMSSLFDELVTRELPENSVYVMTSVDGKGVMRFSPRIVDLDVVVPDRSRDYIGHSLADSQVSFSLELEIYDSVSGELLGTSRRREEDPIKGYLEWANSVSNRRAARLMLMRWVTWLTERLDEAAAGAAHQ